MKNRINWYINRFSLMSPREIGHRIKEETRKKCERFFARNLQVDIPLIDKEIHWYFKVQDRDRIIFLLRKDGMWNEEKAGELLKHKFTFFSFDKKDIGETINWHRDYKNNKEAPLKFCKDIDYRNYSEVGDIKYTWEINRLQHLITLAKAYYITHNNDYKEEVKGQIMSWIESNPYMKGVNWSSSLELGIRLISWSWVWFFLKEPDEDLKKAWLNCIYKHCVYISHNFAKYSSANNHLIGEAAGLFIASVVWPFGEESKKWQAKSLKILVEEMEKQNYEDGVNREQAISYQQFVLDFFLLAGVLGKKNGVVFPESYWNSIEQMLVFMASIMDKNGNVPNIGDSDDGYAVVLSNATPCHYRTQNNAGVSGKSPLLKGKNRALEEASNEQGLNLYQSLLVTGAVLFKRADFKSKAGRFDEKSFWLLGMDGLKEFNALEEKKFIPVKNFEKGGYYILSDSEDSEDEILSVFDCGTLGFLGIAAHGHSDALSFTLNIGGQEFIIDPGTYAYHTEKEWREYFKGTLAHNTVRIDGEDQSVSGGSFMWLKKAQTKMIKREISDEQEIVIGEHNGYKRLSDPVSHRREVFFYKKKKIFKIMDQIKATRKHLIEQSFHFSKDCVVEKTNERTWRIKNGDKIIILTLDEKLKSKLFCGSIDPICGWQSKRFDVKEKAFTLVNSVEYMGNCELETTISIKKG